ncbi:MAG: acyltransferase family protein [Clostridiales bacterium]|nr:acyltransferase family protein [Clostridiales bacterium]
MYKFIKERLINIKDINKNRNLIFDNLKGFLILCVIVGNSLEYTEPHSINLHYLILILYLFHMPLFAFISGYFYEHSSRSIKEMISKIIFLYIFFQIFYYFFEKFLFKSPGIDIELFYPQWTLWYLLTLSCLYVICSFISNKKIWLISSFVIALIIGYDTSVGTHISLSRTFFFLPIFILGMTFKEKYIKTIKKYLKYLIPCLFIILIIVFHYRNLLFVETFFEYTYYEFYYDNPNISLFLRIFHYFSAFIIGSTLLAITTNKKTPLSYLGKNSLILYLSHSGITRLLLKFSLLKYDSTLNIIISEFKVVILTIVVSFIYLKIKEIIILTIKNNYHKA